MKLSIPNETPKAYAAFCKYCNLGDDRSLEKLRQIDGKSTVRYYEQWSTQHRWQDRLKQWQSQEQDRLDDEMQERLRTERREMVSALSLLREKAVQALDCIDLSKVRFGEAARALSLVCDMLCKLDDYYTERVQVDDQEETTSEGLKQDITLILPEDISERRRALRKLAGIGRE